MNTGTIADELFLDTYSLRKGMLVLRAINHQLRQDILRILHQHKRITVTELYMKLRLEQSVASQHLAILRKSGIVVTRRESKFIYYSVNYQRLEDIQQYSASLTQPLHELSV